MDDKQLSIERIFWTDYTTTFSTLVLIFTWIFFLIDRFIQKTAWSPFLPYGAIALTVAGVVVISWRIRLIKSAFEDGWQIKGNVITVSFFRDRGRVSYLYDIQGQRYQSSNAIMKHRVSAGLQSGQSVLIVANKENPKIAFIRDLYV